MKNFLKTMLRGCWIVLQSFCAVIFTTAGILELTIIPSYSGFKVIYAFVTALFAIGVGCLGLYCLGCKEE